jgi:hypothetical protein
MVFFLLNEYDGDGKVKGPFCEEYCGLFRLCYNFSRNPQQVGYLKSRSFVAQNAGTIFS